MPPDPDKRTLRKLKQTLKRAGSKHRRRDLKRQLEENPEGAAEVEENFGRYSSEGLNGMDNDSTRKRRGRQSERPTTDDETARPDAIDAPPPPPSSTD